MPDNCIKSANKRPKRVPDEEREREKSKRSCEKMATKRI